MKYCLLISFLWLVVAQTPTPAQVTFDFQRLQQGQVGIIEVSGANIERVRAAFLDHQFVLYETADDQFIGLIPVAIDAEVGIYRLSILIIYADGQQEYIGREVQVVSGAFGSADLYIPATLAELLDPEIQLDEFAILDDYLNEITPGQQWLITGLQLPERPPGAGFGSYRHFNATVWQRHTGVDYAAPEGTSIIAAAAGQVVFSGQLPIRGEYVLIDHGGGLFSGYAHMSKREVEVGAAVATGDKIGEIGKTGRSTGTHLHWEMALGGVWIDPLWLASWLYESTNSQN